MADNPWAVAGADLPDPEDCDVIDAGADIIELDRRRNEPFDRLPTKKTGFFESQPPLKSVYHTERAETARQRAAIEASDELAEARQTLVSAGLKRVNPAYADVADHNAMTLAYALRYAECGLHVIDAHAIDPKTGSGTGKAFDGKSTAKIPRGAKWQERATNDRNEIIHFWTGDGEYPESSDGEVYPYARVSAPRNVSITFPEGDEVWALDIDGDEGKANLASLEAEHGALPKTAKSISGSGGWHMLFRSERQHFNTASQVAPNIDVRGQGGQIIAAPSVAETGNYYQWEEGCAPWDCGIAHAPEWLDKLVAEASNKSDEGKKTKATPKSKRIGARNEQRGTQGFENILLDIGDHKDGRGFDGPIWRALCSWFGTYGANANASEMIEIVRGAILGAECKDDRAETRYATDDYLLGQTEKAREFVSEHADGFEPPKDWLPSAYKLKGDSIVIRGDDGDKPTPLCQAFDVVGRASTVSGDAGAGRIIHFQNENGVEVEMTLHMADLIRDGGGGVLEALADAGMTLYAGSKTSRDAILNLFRQITPQRHIPTVPRPGWVHDRGGAIDGFLCPTGDYIPASAGTPYRLSSAATVKDRQAMGTLDGWRDAANAAFTNVGNLPPNFFWVIGLAGAFAGPLLALADMDGCGFNLSGDSSRGKSMALMMGSTAWTTPRDKKGVFFGLSGTANAVELLAAIGSESFLALDEIGRMQRPEDLAPLLFGLSSGSGKSRMGGRNVSAGLAEEAEFKVFAMMSNERSLRTVIKGAKADYKTGISARFPDLDVTAGARVSAETIRRMEAVTANFGHAGPEFVRWLIENNWHKRGNVLRAMIDKAAKLLAGENANPAQSRAAKVFALVRVAGKLACRAGLLPDANKVTAAVQRAWDTFKASDEGRATEGETSLLDGFKSWLARNMGSKVIPASEWEDGNRSEVVGWYTDDIIILDWHAIENVNVLGLSGTRTGLVTALKESGALILSGKNRNHKTLPAEVGGGEAKNIRVDRGALGFPAQAKTAFERRGGGR
ncbi:bifunctional DNA primase/polymerase [Ruegeria conchae]|uniref:bifunctional DNA primase/polymerase n=1 Tax=Ruegeria conchae TaxID=981384 RepID=UPI0021A70BAC|nr:bifunctional DNA primase/polymerase [Ruegeria conchae]UWR04358.1 bifunctional DNA primase/polymerase [Ruegeria conchae]